MKPSDAIRQILKDKGWSQRTLGRKCGYPDSSYVSRLLSRDYMSTKALIRLCKGLGYEIIIRGDGREYPLGRPWKVREAETKVEEYQYAKKKAWF